MQLFNKAVAVSFRQEGVISLDNLLMMWQQAAAVGLNFVGIAVWGGELWAMKPITQVQVLRLVLPSTNFVLMLVCSLKALKTVHVATVVVARNLCTVFICALEALIFQRYTSKRAVLGLFIIFAGSVMYGFSDLTFEPQGYAWQLANSLLFIIGSLYEKWAMGKSTDQTALGVSTIKNSLSIGVLGCLMVINGDWHFDGVERLPARTWMNILLSGVGCCALSIAYMMLYKISSATAISVGGNFNKAVSIILAAFLFNSSLGYLQTAGLGISFLGSLQYSLESIRSKDPKVEKSPKAPKTEKSPKAPETKKST